MLIYLRWTVVALLLMAIVQDDARAQIVEVTRNPEESGNGRSDGGRTDSTAERSVEVFSGGGLDVSMDGTGLANARLVQLRIGEPNGSNARLYVFGGIAGNVSADSTTENATTVTSLINPIGGNLNITLEKDLLVLGPPGGFTSVRLIPSIAVRFLSGKADSVPDRGVSLPNVFGQLAVRFLTAAWDDRSPNPDFGVAWLEVAFAGFSGDKARLEEIFGPRMKSAATVFSIAGGINVKNATNLKVAFHKPLNVRHVPEFSDEQWRVALDFFHRRPPK